MSRVLYYECDYCKRTRTPENPFTAPVGWKELREGMTTFPPHGPDPMYPAFCSLQCLTSWAVEQEP